MRAVRGLDGNDFCFRERARPSTRGIPRPVVDPQGRVWPSLSAAARAYRLTYAAIGHRIRTGTAGWRWAGDEHG